MNKIKLKLNILFMISIMILASDCAFAGYDVVRARTVISDEQKEFQDNTDNIVETYDADLPDYSEDKTVTGFFKNKKRKGFFKKNKDEDLIQEEINETSEAQTTQKKSVEVAPENKFQINADKISYDDTDGNVYANGNVEIIANAQNVVLKADDAVLDKQSQTIKLTGKVKIIKDGLEMAGDSLIVDLNEENVLMDNPVAEAYSFVINAQESYLIANDLQMLNGTVSCATKKQFPIIPKRFFRYAPYPDELLYDQDVQNELDINGKKQTYRIDSKEIVITNYKDHNSLVLKGSNVYFNNHKILPKSDIEIISDKQYQVIETNMPEMGTLRSFGTYFGYGFVKRLPKGQILKLMPAITYGDSSLGVGLIGRHRSRNSIIEAGYSTSTERIVARGKYKFGNGFSLLYGKNAYIPDGFMGARRSGYAGQLAFEKAYTDAGTGITFRHGTYAGIFADYNKYGRKHRFTTTRFRENLELSKTLLEYKNKEQDLHLRFSVLGQASATVYGTGHTAGLIRVGPYISTRFKKWDSNISYLQGGIHGDSPFVFDKYRYGRSSIVFNEKFNFNNKFAIGYSGVISPNKDNYERDLMTESRLYVIFGPKDFKIAASYDFIRDIGHIDFMFILGSDSTKINFEKLTTKDMDNSKQKQDFYKKAKTVKVEEI